MRRLLLVLVSFTLLSGPLLLAAPAAAQPLSVSRTAATPPVPPVNPGGAPGSSPRQYMLNILGKVLGPVTPTAWKREQIAYAQRYNHGWETIIAQFGTDTANPNYMGAPNTYQDYVLRNLEMAKKGGTGGLPYTVPSTPLAPAAKIVGGVMNGLSYIAAAETGMQIGKYASRAFGLNVTGGLCDPGFADVGIVALVTATDCSAQGALSPAYQAALAANPGVVGGLACSVDSGYCVQLVQVAPYGNGPAFQSAYCFTETGSRTYAGALYIGQLSETAGVGGAQLWDYSPASNTDPKGDTSLVPQYACFRAGVVLPSLYYGPSLRGNVATSPVRYRVIDQRTGVFGPEQTAQSASQSQRTVQCSITGDNGSVYTSSTAAYSDSAGVTPPAVCPTLPSGVAPFHVTTQSVGVAGNRPISSQDTTAASRSLWTTYPECRDGQCKLDLKQTGAGTPSCFDLQATCNGWFADPAKDTKYQCTYGTHPVTLDECAVYSGVFDPARIAAGAPYSDPMTGVWSGGANAPSPDKQAMAQTVQNPDVMRTCNGLAASSSFDPVSFVMRPIQCALEWAFVPRDAVVKTSLLQVNGAWSTTPFGSVVPLLSQFSSIPVFTGCDGLPVDFVETWPVHWEVHWRFGAACTGPLATLAGTVRAVLGLGVAILGVLGFTRYFGASLGFIGFGRRGDHE